MPFVTFGLWPIAGITTVGVSESDAQQTLLAAIDCGITSFDSAFSYGYDGQCDRLLGSAVRSRRDDFTIISKVGQRWNSDRTRVIDGNPASLIADAETSLDRMGIEKFDLMMLHCPDPQVPIERSAEAIEQLRRRGLCDRIGVCNVGVEDQQRFAKAASCDAIQCPLNLLQRGCLDELVPQCERSGCDVYVFWVLMKGLLAGRISRDHQFAAGDVRPNYEIFQGQPRQRAHDVIDRMGEIADDLDMTIAQLSIGWALSQPGITSTLVGARRPDQIQEVAMSRPLAAESVAAIDRIVAEQID